VRLAVEKYGLIAQAVEISVILRRTPILLFTRYNVNILFLRADDKVRAAHVIDSLLR